MALTGQASAAAWTWPARSGPTPGGGSPAVGEEKFVGAGAGAQAAADAAAVDMDLHMGYLL